ncbi:MAG: heme-binding domain-containing protein [Chloroflexi bacterium]|nr:heme-binding domain-containing protein [Chloroflexota bacterium]
MKKWLKRIGIAVIIILIAIQLIPVNRTNPPVTREVKWDSPATRALAQRACSDCHSNETTWPWYGYVAPVSLFLADHINEGRGRLNFSEWDKPNTELDEVVKNIKNNEMPLWDFLLMHPEAKLTDAEKTALIAGFEATFRQDPPIARPEGARGD